LRHRHAPVKADEQGSKYQTACSDVFHDLHSIRKQHYAAKQA
jgi:hypothetical protein